MARFSRTHKVCIVNEKGGCGKTTCVVNIAHEFAMRGVRVLIVDMDKQRDATDTLLSAPQPAPKRTVADLVRGQARPLDLVTPSPRVVAIESESNGSIDVIPAHPFQHTLEKELQLGFREQAVLSSLDERGQADPQAKSEIQAALELSCFKRFRDQIETVNGHYDLVLFDTPGNPGLLTNLALSASDWALTVIQPSGFDVKGIGQLRETLRLVRELINPRLRLVGCLLNGVRPGSLVAKHWNAQIGQAFGSEAQFQATIPHSVRFAECANRNITIFEHPGQGTASLQEVFRRIVAEMLEKGEQQIQRDAEQMLSDWGETERRKAGNE